MTDTPVDEDIRYSAAATALVTVALKQAERDGLDPCALMQTAAHEFVMTIVANGHPRCALKVLQEIAGEVLGRPVVGFALDAPSPAPIPTPAGQAAEAEIDEITEILNRHTEGVVH